MLQSTVSLAKALVVLFGYENGNLNSRVFVEPVQHRL